MNVYVRNKKCPCVRCRTSGMMWPAILITLGVLALLHNYRVVLMHNSAPVLLLVIGAVLLVSRTGSTEGHIDPPMYTAVAPPPMVGQQPIGTPGQQSWTSGAPTTPPPPSTESTDPQVNP
jgi:hypothetical protein